jgi:hypothetical protein
MKVVDHLRYRSRLMHAMAVLLLLAIPARPITAQPVRCSIETDKQNYMHDEPVLVLLRIENLTTEKVRVRFAPVDGSNRFLGIVSVESGATYTLVGPGQRALTIDALSISYDSKMVDLLLYDQKTGNSGYLPSGEWHLRFDIIVSTEVGVEHELPLRALIHVQARTEGDTARNILRAAKDLARERRKSRSEEYELPEEYHDLMNSPNSTPYRNGVLRFYYWYLLNDVGRDIAKRQGGLYENRVEYVERLLRHFAAWPDEVQAVWLWHNTIGLMFAPPPDICERALAIPGIENTRLGRYLREYACRESAAEKGGK